MKKKLFSFLILVAFSLTMLVMPADAATVTVSSKSELLSAVSSAKAGTVIVLKNGTYKDLGEIKITKSGTASSKIVLRPQTPGGVRFTGKLTFYFQASYIVIKDFYFDQIHFDKNSDYATTNLIKFSGAQYCELSGNYFYNCGNATDMGKTGTGIYGMYTPIVELSKGSRYNTISNNVFRNNFSISVAVVAKTEYDNSYNVIENNCFKDIRSVYSWWGNVSSGNGMECIQIGQNADTKTQQTYTTIRNNLFENIGGDGAEVVSIKTSNNTIEHNTFRNCSGGLVLRVGNNNVADGNFMFYTKGIRVYEDGHIIKNNYIGDSEMGIFLDGSDGSNHFAATNVRVHNNTVINSYQYGIRIGKSSNTELPSNITVKNNYVWLQWELNEQYKAYKNFGCNGLTISGNMCTVNGSNQGLFGGVTHTTSANMIWSSDEGIYRPGPESDLVNKGEYVEGMEYDIDGQKRLGRPDCGADEFLYSEIVYKPLDIYTVCPENQWWIDVCYNGYNELGRDSGTNFEVSDGKIIASRTIVTFNEEPSPVSKTVILAEYDGKKLVKMASQTKSIYEADTYSYSVSLDHVAEHTYKTFFWNTTEGDLIPLEHEMQYKN